MTVAVWAIVGQSFSTRNGRNGTFFISGTWPFVAEYCCPTPKCFGMSKATSESRNGYRPEGDGVQFTIDVRNGSCFAACASCDPK